VQADKSRKKPILLNAVEYRSERGGDLRSKGPVLYVGIRPRSSDGHMCLMVRAPHARRNFNIPMASVEAVTTKKGVRHPLEVPAENWRLRAEEVRWIVEKTREPWAHDAFDPDSASYFKQAPTRHTTSPEIEPISPPIRKAQEPKPGLFGAWDKLLQSVRPRPGVR